MIQDQAFKAVEHEAFRNACCVHGTLSYLHVCSVVMFIFAKPETASVEGEPNTILSVQGGFMQASLITLTTGGAGVWQDGPCFPLGER